MSEKDTTSDAGKGQTGKDQAGSENLEAEILQPEHHGARKKQRGAKPTTIDGEASDVTPEEEPSGTAGAGADAGSSSSQNPSEGSAKSPTWILPTGLGLVAGLAGGVLASYVLMTELGGAGSDDAAMAALDQRIALLDTRLAQLNGDVSARLSASGAAQAKQFTSLQTDLETKAGQTELDARFERFQSALKMQQDQMAGLQETLALTGGPVNERLAVLEVQSPKLRADLDLLRAALPRASLEREVGDLTAAMSAQQTALGALGPQVIATQQKLVALELEINKPSGAEQAALGLALANLTRAAIDGQAFEVELEAISSLTGDTPGLEALREFGESGVATRATLAQQFDPMVQGVFTAEREAGREGFWARMVASASSVITIRKQGEIDGNDTQAVVARMEQRMAANDLAGAVDQSGLLLGVAKDAAAPWVDTATARLALDKLLGDVSAQLIRSFDANRKDAD